METQITLHPDNNYPKGLISTNSAVAWCAVFAGAVASAALSLILLFLGTGFGLTLVSPWSSEGISAAGFGVSSILAITAISLLASAMGGYLAGRLRTRWVDAPRDEVFFRDTAHGFLSWSVATLGTAALLTTVIGSIIGGGVKASAAVVDGASNAATALVMNKSKDNGTSHANDNTPLPYLLDRLLRQPDNSSAVQSVQSAESAQSAEPAQSAETVENRKNPENPLATKNPPTKNLRYTAHGQSSRGELTRIFVNALTTTSLSENDLKYAGRLVAQYTKIDQRTAEKRVAETFAELQTKVNQAETEIKEAADKARKATAYSSLWIFISLLSGAFIASLMAVYGGRQRDL